jgi:hypothetical protein
VGVQQPRFKLISQRLLLFPPTPKLKATTFFAPSPLATGDGLLAAAI